jgi:hypothetical protein
MSVIVDVQIASGAAFRRMAIYCISNVIAKDSEGHPDHEQVREYEVEVQQRIPARQPVLTATFQHRYGDDVFILIAKAGEAIRERYGHT